MYVCMYIYVHRELFYLAVQTIITASISTTHVDLFHFNQLIKVQPSTTQNRELPMADSEPINLMHLLNEY
jgi:hypothetical protein